jgi:competence protein ComEC
MLLLYHMTDEGKKNYVLLFLVIILTVCLVYLFRIDLQSRKTGLTFAMLDVGQGDALFIESPTGTQVLIDAGPARRLMGPLSQIMSPFDRSIDAIVITNPDADHISGFADVLKKYEVGILLEPGTFNESKTFQNIKDEIERKNIPDVLAKKGMKLDLGGDVFIDILFPDRDVSTWNPNDGSIVARLSYGDTSVMLTGDATIKTEKIILEDLKRENLKSMVLKVGHHGSRTSSSDAFVKAVAPRYALISDAKDNKYGHPHQEVVDLFSEIGAKIMRTDLLGTIVMKCDRMAVCEIN